MSGTSGARARRSPAVISPVDDGPRPECPLCRTTIEANDRTVRFNLGGRAKDVHLECYCEFPHEQREDIPMAKARVPEKSGGAFLPCPAGTHNAVCVDAVDLHDVERSYGGETWKEEQVRFVFQVEKRITETDARALQNRDDAAKLVGQRYSVRTFGMKVSLHDKAKLRAFVEGWLGESLPVGYEFDSEAFVGRPCFLTVVHKLGGDDGKRVYANITGIAPVMKDDAGNPFRPVIAPEGYTREVDRAPATSEQAPPHDDADVQF